MSLSLLDFAKYAFPHYAPTPVSHATQIQEADAKAEARLLKLLGQSTDWLYQMRYDNGLAWLKQHYGFDPRLEGALAKMPSTNGAERNSFWAWWLNGWQQRDTALSAKLLVLKSGAATFHAGTGHITMIHTPAELATLYYHLHDPKGSQMLLPGFVLAEAKTYLRTALPEE